MECFNSGKYGHKAKEYRRDATCCSCGETGHYQSECRNKPRKETNKSFRVIQPDHQSHNQNKTRGSNRQHLRKKHPFQPFNKKAH